jgi:hypothetical protein
MSNEVKLIGFTDFQTTCDCCGRKELKGTYCIDVNGEELYYGSSCAIKTYSQSLGITNAKYLSIALKNSLYQVRQDLIDYIVWDLKLPLTKENFNLVESHKLFNSVKGMVIDKFTKINTPLDLYYSPFTRKIEI